jgi:hypothetical protein
VQADVQKRGWVGVSAGVIDEQPPAGRSSVPKRASDSQHTPTSDPRLGGEARKREQGGRSP